MAPLTTRASDHEQHRLSFDIRSGRPGELNQTSSQEDFHAGNEHRRGRPQDGASSVGRSLLSLFLLSRLLIAAVTLASFNDRFRLGAAVCCKRAPDIGLRFGEFALLSPDISFVALVRLDQLARHVVISSTETLNCDLWIKLPHCVDNRAGAAQTNK
jgi:hypothetical protein